jgi:LmbE family N-acetylglucosaminyl deacetylase
VLCTSGDVGIAKTGMTRQEAAVIREVEQREACRITGVQEAIFLGEPDGMLVATLELRKKLVREIRRFRPEVVITGDPTRVWSGDSYINHPDHRAASAAALDAVFPAAGQPNLFEEIAEEGFKAHKPRKVYVTTWDEADVFINIEETIETKIEALRAHKSQMKDWDPEPRIKEWAASRGKGKEMAYAECFRVITLVSDEDWKATKGCVIECDDDADN